MPLYDFRCDSGHLFESFETNIDCESRRCRHCRRNAKRVWISRRTFEREAQTFIPPVIFKSRQGQTAAPYIFPGRNDEQCPEGYERIELRTVNQVRRFEKEYNEHGKREHAAMLEIEQARYNIWAGKARKQAERMIKTGPPHLRLYAERLLQRIDSKDFSGEAKRFEPGFTVEAFSYDASNRHRCDDARDMRERQRR